MSKIASLQAGLDRAASNRAAVVAAPPTPPTSSHQPETPPVKEEAKSRAGKVHVGAYLPEGFRRSLRRVQAETGEDTQTLIARALNDLFKAHNVPVVDQDRARSTKVYMSRPARDRPQRRLARTVARMFRASTRTARAAGSFAMLRMWPRTRRLEFSEQLAAYRFSRRIDHAETIACPITAAVHYLRLRRSDGEECAMLVRDESAFALSLLPWADPDTSAMKKADTLARTGLISLAVWSIPA